MSCRQMLIVVSLWLSASALLIVPLKAQNARGSILGHVQDPSGAAVPGAKVTLKNEGTAITSTFTTDSTGDYLFLKLIPGTYDLTVEASGFRTDVVNSLLLQVDQTLRQDLTLAVGTVTQEVTVSAGASMLQSDSPTIGQVTSERFIQALPLLGRDFTTLIAINAGVTQPAGGIQTGVFGLHGLDDTWKMSSVNGSRPASISYIVDGVADNDYFFTVITSVPSEDAIQEFKVQNGLYSAEYGNGAGQINVALKSGTNALHGSAYDFIRNDAFQPRSPLIADINSLNAACQAQKTVPPCSLTKTPFKQNLFGFTLGGPVRLPHYNGRNKSFWFFSYEGGRRRVTSGPGFAQVPTAAERSGDFSDWPYPIYDPSTTTYDATGKFVARTRFPGNKIPSINSVSQKLLNYLPQPNINCTMPCPNFQGFVSNPFDTDTVTARFDQRLGERDSLSYNMNVGRYNSLSGSFFPTAATQNFARPRLFGLEWNHSFSPNATNTARVGYNRRNFHFGLVSSFGPNLSADLGFQNTTSNPAFYGIPQLFVQDGYSTGGTSNNGYTQRNNVYQFVDNFQQVHGRHTFTVGADIRRAQLLDADGFTANGSLTFTGSYTAANPSSPNIGRAAADSGNAFADLLLGDPLRAGAPVPIASDLFDLRGTSWSLFFQDDFRVTPRLTLNLGLRYEIPATLHSTDNSGATFNPKTPGGGLIWVDRNFVQQLAGFVNNPALSNIYLQCCITNQLVPVDKHDFAPRLGFAWRPLNTSRFVVRGGYGISYDIFMRFYDGENFDDNILTAVQRNPNYPVALGSEKVSPLALNSLWLPPISIQSFGLPKPFLFGIETEWPDNHTPYMQQWSLDTQYQFSPNLMLDLGYVGSRTLHQPIQWEFNAGFPPAVFGDPCNVLRDRSQATGGSASCLTDPNFQPVDTRVPFPNFSPSSFANANILFSNYHSLQARLEKRYSVGLQFMANYTYSKALDEGSEIAAFGGESLNLVQDQHNIRADYGPASFDQTHRLVLSYSYDLPVGKGRRFSLGKANWIVGGWKTAGIVTFATGLPETIACCGRTTTQWGTPFQDTVHANVNGNPNSGFTQSIFQWFNPSVFSIPPFGSYGNAGRGTVRGPMLRQGNLTFYKETAITERQSIQLRLEIFNAFSSWHTGNVFPNNRVQSSPVNCIPGPGPGPLGNCNFGSLVGLNGFGDANLWNPHIIQLALKYTF